MAITQTNGSTISTVRIVLGGIAHRLGLETKLWACAETGTAGHAWPMMADERRALRDAQAIFDRMF